MPIQKEEQNQDFIDDYQTDDVEEIEEDDYGFIFGPDGELKSVIFPELLMEDPPRQIKKILKMYGIKNIHDVIEKNIH